ncbi:DinB family protein [Phytomonospora sp. NPDC050363]|uniref:DinB family protein n=1 Tax=Phytomonospora sp. NPDC050363 TaxID=3155642 RepID=UPI0034117084
MTDTSARGDLRPPSLNADETTTLRVYLDYLREAVMAKVDGVCDTDARTPGVGSGTSLAWLLSHLTAVEHNWFVWSYEGTGELMDDDALAEGTIAELLDGYRAAVDRANKVIHAHPDLDRPGERSLRETPPPSLRWTLVHMIEETARHAGHADILREQLDGAVGR